jgi:hypothetical protein
MLPRRVLRPFIGVLIVAAAGMLSVRVVQAHCDGLDGPVVKAARHALETGNVNLVLIWVRPQDEPEIRTAFQQTTAVRKLGRQAQSLADRSFFETLVRIHRGGEGAPYTGLKPAGQDLGPAIPAADRALASSSISALQALLTRAVQHGLREHFDELGRLRDYAPDDIAAGRRYVRAYVEYIHYVERLHEAATGAAPGHYGN